jgi:hypothetical protein
MKGIEMWLKSSKSALKWSEVKCSEVRWNGAVGNLDGVKPNEREVKCSWVKFEWEEVEWNVIGWSVVMWCIVMCSEGLRNRVSNILRRYTDYMKFAAYIGFSFIMFFSYSFDSIFYHCIYGCMFRMFLFNFVNYVFCIVMFMYSYCYVCSVPCILFHCVVLCIVFM